MNNVMAQSSSGPSGSYLAAQAITGINYASPSGGTYIRRIMNSVRTGNGQVFVYYADDAMGSNAKIIYHLGDNSAYKQSDIRDLWIPIPTGKYLLTYGVGTIYDTTFTIAEHATPTELTVSAASITGYATLKSSNTAFMGPAKINRVIFMSTSANSLGYLYWADDASGTNANVLRGYAAGPIYGVVDCGEDCVEIPSGKYLLAHAEIGSFSCAVTVCP